MTLTDQRRRGALVLWAAACLMVVGGGLVVGCSDDGGADDASGTSDVTTTDGPTSTEEATTEAAPTSDGPGATLGPNCTVGTIPEHRTEPGCDRLYSPFVAPGQVCAEGQASECIDPDGDGTYTWVLDGGQCLVERQDPTLCRDDDGDGQLDDPLGGRPGPHAATGR